MIIVTDAAGQCIHASQEWTALTGQEIADAFGRGWLARVHPDDRAVVAETLDAAITIAAEFSVRCRLLRRDGSLCWVGAGGVPSFGIETREFIGYLGSITVLAEGAVDTATAYGSVERFIPPTPHPETMPTSSLDMVADHLILAYTLIEADGGKEALPDLREALFKIGQALAARTTARTRPLN